MKRRSSFSSFLAKFKEKQERFPLFGKSRSTSNLTDSHPYGNDSLFAIADNINTLDDLHQLKLEKGNRDPNLQIYGAFTAAIKIEARVFQGRIYLTNRFVLFVSSPCTKPLRLRLFNKDILALKATEFENLPNSIDFVCISNSVQFVNIAHRDALISTMKNILNQKMELWTGDWPRKFENESGGKKVFTKLCAGTPFELFNSVIKEIDHIAWNFDNNEKSNYKAWHQDFNKGNKKRELTFTIDSLDETLYAKQEIVMWTPDRISVSSVYGTTKTDTTASFRYNLTYASRIGEVSTDLEIITVDERDTRSFGKLIADHLINAIRNIKLKEDIDCDICMEAVTLALPPTSSLLFINGMINPTICKEIYSFLLRPLIHDARSKYLSSLFFLSILLVLRFVFRILYSVFPVNSSHQQDFDTISLYSLEAEVVKYLSLIHI
mgnify:CR=1 FL=1